MTRDEIVEALREIKTALDHGLYVRAQEVVDGCLRNITAQPPEARVTGAVVEAAAPFVQTADLLDDPSWHPYDTLGLYTVDADDYREIGSFLTQFNIKQFRELRAALSAALVPAPAQQSEARDMTVRECADAAYHEKQFLTQHLRHAERVRDKVLSLKSAAPAQDWRPIERKPLEPGEQPPISETVPDLLCDGLRHANHVSEIFNEIAALGFSDAEIEADPRLTKLHELLLRRFSDYSGLPLFISADRLRLELPTDLREKEDGR